MSKKKQTGYKAFNEKFQCNGFQYEEGKTYKHEGEAKICASGFHYCALPLDVLDYYDLIGSRFAEVEAIPVETSGNKSVTAKLHVKKEIGIAGLIKSHVELIFSFCFKKEDGKAAKDSTETISKDRYSQLAASGASSQLAASGAYSKLAASGASSKLAASGDSSKLAADGKNSIAAGIGWNNRAKAKNGCWIVLAEWEWIDNIQTPVCVKTGKIGEDGLKADVYYKLEGGKFVEAV